MIVEATILCAEGERRSLNLDLVALNTAAGVKFDDKPSALGDFTKLKSVLGHRLCSWHVDNSVFQLEREFLAAFGTSMFVLCCCRKRECQHQLQIKYVYSILIDILNSVFSENTSVHMYTLVEQHLQSEPIHSKSYLINFSPTQCRVTPEFTTAEQSVLALEFEPSNAMASLICQHFKYSQLYEFEKFAISAMKVDCAILVCQVRFVYPDGAEQHKLLLITQKSFKFRSISLKNSFKKPQK